MRVACLQTKLIVELKLCSVKWFIQFMLSFFIVFRSGIINLKTSETTINDLIQRALLTCGFPAIREPSGSRSDGKKPDGLTLIPWKCGKPLIWDFNSAYTTRPSYIASTSRRAGSAAKLRENSKKTKYSTR